LSQQKNDNKELKYKGSAIKSKDNSKELQVKNSANDEDFDYDVDEYSDIEVTVKTDAY
jgi:hypothetical protein